MRISEIRQREDFERIFCATLERGLGLEHGIAFRVNSDRETVGRHVQRWRQQPLLSAFFHEQISRTGRLYLANLFRYTSRRSRLPFQWLLGTALASRPGLRITGQWGFEIEPSLPTPSELVFLPGNQRVRTLDFGRRRSRVFLKVGFDSRTMQREIAVRATIADPRESPFAPILSHDPDALWFEEDLLEGYSLARCPPWHSRERYEHQALTALDRWLARSTRQIATSAHVRMLIDRILSAAQDLSRILSTPVRQISRLAHRLAESALGMDAVDVAHCHGDLQAGNIFVEIPKKRALLIDWEFSGLRFRDYDFFTYGLALRSPDGLAARLNAFVNDGSLRLPASFRTLTGRDRTRRRAVLAVILLEELDWQLSQAHGADLKRMPASLHTYVHEVEGHLGSRHGEAAPQNWDAESVRKVNPGAIDPNGLPE